MRQLEADAQNKGIAQELLMEEAGKQIANAIISFVKEQKLSQKVLIAAGKGNNGGDGYVAARHLIAHGFSVQVWQALSLEPTSLTKKQRRRFEARSGKVFDLDQSKPQMPSDGVILDALFGTGFKGALSPAILEYVKEINNAKLPIISIDVPSGLDAKTGEVQSDAIAATLTLAIECPKIGYFLQNGVNHVGQIIALPIGLTVQNSKWQLLEEKEVKGYLPPIVRNRHKYAAGHVVGIGGGNGMAGGGMAGASILASYAALKSGAGIVHLLHNQETSFEFVGMPHEVVKVPYIPNDLSLVTNWCNCADALFLGPGLGTTAQQEAVFATIWPLCQHKKMVIDADAITLLVKMNTIGPLPNAILTPHLGELERLLSRSCKEGVTLELLETCQQFVEKEQTNLVLKGYPTFLFSPATPIQILLRGDPGMATAGSGDVLTGILAATLAQGLSAKVAMRFASFLHCLAGEHAANEETSYSVTASSITNNISKAYKSLILSN
jgi:NAD(P)H-hydrate epimerase